MLDTSIANVSIPTIAGNLGVSSDQGTWVITSFAVANGVSVPLTGWLMQRFGVVRTFVVSVVLFTLASLLCGLAWSLPSLIVFRVLQGAVSGPMIPGSQALLINVFGPAKRPTALAIWSMTTLVAPIAGPLLGGYISDNYAWPWIFLINVPVGIVLRLRVLERVSKAQETPTRKLPDRPGGPGAALRLGRRAADHARQGQGPGLVPFGHVIVVLLDRHGGRVRRLAHLGASPRSIRSWISRLFKSRSFTLGTLALCLGYAVFFGNIVLMPLWLQSYRGLYRHLGGNGVGAERRDRRHQPRSCRAADAAASIRAMLGATSFVLFAISYFMRAGLTADASFFAFTAPQLVQGIAMGMFFVSLLAVIFDGLPPQKIRRGIRTVELSAHHRRQFRHLAHHHVLGPARGLASVATRRHHQRVLARLSAIAHPTPPRGVQRPGRRRRHDPGARRPKLPAIVAGSLLSVGMAVRGADPAVLSRTPPRRRRSGTGGGGLSDPRW